MSPPPGRGRPFEGGRQQIHRGARMSMRCDALAHRVHPARAKRAHARRVITPFVRMTCSRAVANTHTAKNHLSAVPLDIYNSFSQ